METLEIPEKSQKDIFKETVIREGKKYYTQLESKVGDLWAKIIVGCLAFFLIVFAFSVVSDSPADKIEDSIAVYEEAIDDLLYAYEERDPQAIQKALFIASSAGDYAIMVSTNNINEVSKKEKQELYESFTKAQSKADEIIQNIAASGMIHIQ